MKDKFIQLYNNQYEKIDFSVSIDEVKEIARQNNIDVIHYKIKSNQVTFVGDKNWEKQHVASQFMITLKLVAEKYPDLDLELLHCQEDYVPSSLINLPIFCVSNNPSKGTYNPITFYEHAQYIKFFEEKHYTQSKFIEKRTKVFGRYGISGFQDVNLDNLLYNYKLQFALSSIICPELIDIKFLLVPHDFTYWESHINEMFIPEVKQIMLSLPLFDTNVTNVWIQTIDQAFDSKVCVFNEGNSNASLGRILTCLHNDGVVFKIGRHEYQSFLDITISSIDEKLVYDYNEKPDNRFYDSVENSLSDEKYRITKNRIVNEYFNQSNLIDLTYETLKLYNVLVKK